MRAAEKPPQFRGRAGPSDALAENNLWLHRRSLALETQSNHQMQAFCAVRPFHGSARSVVVGPQDHASREKRPMRTPKPRTRNRLPRRFPAEVTSHDPRRISDELPAVADRIDLALETLVGSRWLMTLACESLKDSAGLQADREEAIRLVRRMDELVDSLRERRAKGIDPSEDALSLCGRVIPAPRI